MKPKLFAGALLYGAMLCALAVGVQASSDRLTVITTIPDLADMAREIGGNHVSVESMARGTEDPHAVPVRPSLAAKLARADVLIEVGLDLEHAFLPALLDASNNPRLRSDGLIVASEGIVPKDVPTIVSRTQGEQHPSGNPHVNLDPGAGRIMAQNICDGLKRVSPGHAAEFDANLKNYLEKIDAREKEWKAAGAKLKGVKFVSFHPEWVYFADYFGMVQVGTIEPKPGIPPSAGHTAELIETMKQSGARIVIQEPHYSDQMAREVAEKAGARAVKCWVMANPSTPTWIGMIDANVKALVSNVQ